MAKPSQAIDTGTRHTALVQGRECAYWRYGKPDGKTVVLIHGFRGDHHGLELIANHLANFDVIVPDLPGFGDSEALRDSRHDLDALGAWLREFILTLNVDRYTLVGHSFGTLVVASALSHDLTPTRVVLINPISAPALEGPKGILSKVAHLYYLSAQSLPSSLGNALLKNRIMVRAMSEVMAKTKDKQLRAWIHGQHARYFSSFANRDVLLEMFEASISTTVPQYAASFTMQTVIVAGEIDDITPLAEQLRLAATLADSKIIIAEGVGHLTHYEAPKLAASAITSATE